MGKYRIFAIAGLMGAFALCAGGIDAATAKPGGKGAKGGHPHGFSQGMKTGWRGAAHPPGWSRGNKRGWYKHRGGSMRHAHPGWR